MTVMNYDELINRAWTPDDKEILKNMLESGIKAHMEMDDLKEHINDLTQDSSDKLNIPPAQLRQAIRSLHKGDLQAVKDKVAALEELLTISGKILI